MISAPHTPSVIDLGKGFFYARIFLFMCLCAFIQEVTAQPYLGFRGATNGSTLVYKDNNYLSDNNYRVQPRLGFEVGGLFYYRVRSYWGFQIEVNYAERSRVLSREGPRYINDELLYQQLDIPVFFRFNTKGRKVRFHISAGPHISFLLRSRGKFSSGVLRRGLPLIPGEAPIDLGGPDILEYELYSNFNQATEANNSLTSVVAEGLNTVQLGLDVAIGLHVPIINESNIFFFDIRYRHSQSHVGRNQETTQETTREVLRGYQVDYEAALRSLSVSAGVVFRLGGGFVN